MRARVVWKPRLVTKLVVVRVAARESIWRVVNWDGSGAEGARGGRTVMVSVVLGRIGEV